MSRAMQAVAAALLVTLVGCPTGSPFDPNAGFDPNSLIDPNDFLDPNDLFDPNDFLDPNDLFDPNDLPDPNSQVNPNDANAPAAALALFDEGLVRVRSDLRALRRQRRRLGRAARPVPPRLRCRSVRRRLRRQARRVVARVERPARQRAAAGRETYLEVATSAVTQNYTTTPRNRYAAANYQTLGDNVVWHTWYTGDIGYIRVDTLSSAAFADITDADIDAMISTYTSADGLILDIRPNNGGDETIARRFASHFTDTQRTYGYTKTRNGPQPRRFRRAERESARTRGERPVPQADGLPDRPAQPQLGRVVHPDDARVSECHAHRATGHAAVRATPRNSRSRQRRALHRADPGSRTPTRWSKSRMSASRPTSSSAAAESYDGEHDYVVERALEGIGRLTRRAMAAVSV